uniref:Endonuclease/exonuclease/phosphatase domain-containing protein n=1 Tax=Rhipicephalus zambeziensis TaxID=60191 RepID=A0A224YIS2_9ACAR
MAQYPQTYSHTPFVLAGDFNVDITTNDWLVHHMIDVYSLRRISDDNIQPTTIRGTCIDLIFANFTMKTLQKQPLTLHFTDHKAVVFKAPRAPTQGIAHVP